jgi:hypothetical protein
VAVVGSNNENKFAMLARLGQAGDVAVAEPPRRRRRSSCETSKQQQQQQADALKKTHPVEDGAATRLAAAAEDESSMLEGLHRLDSFLLSHIFSHLHDGPQLARLRRVRAFPFHFIHSFIQFIQSMIIELI